MAPSSLELVLQVPRPVHRLHEAAGDDAAGPPAHPVKEVEARDLAEKDSVKATLQEITSSGLEIVESSCNVAELPKDADVLSLAQE